MAFRVGVRAITVSDGTEIAVPATGVLAVVGPNNSGKSVALREIWEQLAGDVAAVPPPRVVIREVEVDKEGTPDELQAWLETHCLPSSVQISPGVTARNYRRPGGAAVIWETLRSEWANVPSGFGGNSVQLFGLFASAESRLGMIGGGASLWDAMTDVPQQPIQLLYADPELEERFSLLSTEAFGLEISLSRAPGTPINFYVGRPHAEPSLIPSREYLEELRRLPLLQSQGDGIRGFLGLMLPLVTASYPIVVVDEPEAFLHPPQARLLGRKLAEEASGSAQVILATHDVDVLLGLLDAEQASVTIVRIVRRGHVNPVAVLPPETLRALWRDPLLRYSRILDGLFHRGVLLCEGDTDARYYAAVLDAVRSDQEVGPHDFLLTHCGGKARMATVVAALRAVDVPIVVIADFDVLREEARVRELIEALGGTWDEYAADWRIIDAAVRGLDHNPSKVYVEEQVKEVLTRAGGVLTRTESDRIREVTRVEDGWSAAKRTGLTGLPQGDASDRAEHLLDRLRAIGLFVVPHGEVERWEPGVPGEGPRWVNAVLDANLHARADAPAREFVQAAVAAIG
jgi:AAA domain, putative AbiEii toxin, Type IV TA system